MLAAEFPEVEVLRLAANTGGAGGFSAAIKYLLEEGTTDFAWLMDDDAEPKLNALEPLATIAQSPAGQQVGFISSRIETPDGRQIAAYKYPAPNRAIPTAANAPVGTRPIAYSIFVGILVNMRIAKRTFLPVSDFFIWWDDTEYSARLQQLAGGFECPESVVMHPEKPELKDLGERLYFDIRNRLWVLLDRRLGSPSSRQKSAATLWYRIRRQARNSKRKTTYLKLLLAGLVHGFFRRPKLQFAEAWTYPTRSDHPKALD
jgi:GT2 family glycosyltransferase